MSMMMGPFLTLKAQNSKNSAVPADFDKYIAKVLETFEVPGMAVGIVKDGKVILNKGYGVREENSNTPVDSLTLFPIASNSKAFTATALALLVERGQLDWDEPVITYLPDFRLSNPYVTSELSVRDLLVHRSGIAPYAGDLLQFPPTTYTRSEVVHRLRYLPLNTSFRSTYAYDNVLYLVAAEVIKAVSGMDWEEFIKREIFDKVGMKNSLSRFSDFPRASNRASSHAHVDGTLKILKDFDERGLGDVSNPAGGIVSNVRDMSRWLVTQLDSGKTPSSERLFSPRATRELWTGVTPMPILKVNPWIEPAQTDFDSYGLGFRIYSYRNTKMVTHGGKLDGFVSFVNMVPDLGLGIVVLTNQESTNAYRAVINKILDFALGAEEFDWLQGFRKEEDQKFDRIKTVEREVSASRDSDSRPVLPLDAYTGRFQDPWYGDIDVTLKDGRLIMDFKHSPMLIGHLEFWQYNTFIVRWENRDLKADAFVTYFLDEQGKVKEIEMKAVSPATDVSYDFHDLNIKPAI